jgi:hypothetical protein
MVAVAALGLLPTSSRNSVPDQASFSPPVWTLACPRTHSAASSPLR